VVLGVECSDGGEGLVAGGGAHAVGMMPEVNLHGRRF